MNKASMAVRILLGILFLVFGLNGFFHFLPMPPMQGDSQAFIMLLVTSKLLYVIKGIEVACSILLLTGFFVPLALTLLAPVIFNIFWFHVTLAPEGAPMAIGIVVATLFLMWNYRKAWSPLFKK